MTTQDKINNILEGNWVRHERKTAAAYLWALHRNKEDVIASFEKYGPTPRHIIMNKHQYEAGLKYGFKEIVFAEYGWLKRIDWLNNETIEFKTKKDHVSHNHVSVGMGLNGKWTWGVFYSYGYGGGASGLSEYREPLPTREEALLTGLNDLISKHRKAKEACRPEDDEPSYKSSYSESIVSQAQAIIDKLSGRKQEQLSLFDL